MRPPTRIVLHFRTTHRNVVYSGIRADGNGRRYGRSSASREAAAVFRTSSTTPRANPRYADSSTKSRPPRNSNACSTAVFVRKCACSTTPFSCAFPGWIRDERSP